MSAVRSDGDLVDDLVRMGRALGGDVCGDREPAVLWDRADGLVVRLGDVVIKAHAPETDAAELAGRLRVAASQELCGVLLAPLGALRGSAPVDAMQEAACGGLAMRVRGRLVTAWPAGEPVNPEDPDAAPWEEAAALLARLHSTPLDAAAGPLPRAGGPRRVARAMARLRAAGHIDAGADIEGAFTLLPPWAQGATMEAPGPAGDSGRAGRSHALVHGDWHLGQIVRCAAGTGAFGWRLIDVDDLGMGDPAWDLARPAAWFAAGLLPPEVWWRFLSAYRMAGGCAVPANGDPWPALDVPARALAVQSAALAVVAARRDGRPLDEAEATFVDACRRMVVVDAPRRV
jgi:hypothetical protein